VERSEVGDQVLAAAGRLTAVAVMKNHTAQTVRDLIARVLFGFEPVRQAMANTMSEVSIGYKHSPLNGPSAHGVSGPAPGKRVLPVVGQVPVGSGDRPRFALFAESDFLLVGHSGIVAERGIQRSRSRNWQLKSQN
jgi:hypothetical protein